MERLRRHGLTVKLTKCSWGLNEVEYPGHRVGKGKIAIPDHRVEAIINNSRVKNLRAFLGTIRYYQDFAPALAEATNPLDALTTKKAPNHILWTDELTHCFQEAERILSDATALMIPRKESELLLQTDAS